MSFYINQSDAREVLTRMKKFESDLRGVYSSWEYDFRENLGRRNALVSMAQEAETARVLSRKFKGVSSDGAPGKPDIVIEEIDAELECKLTSGSRSGNSVTFDFRTDWETICNKGQLDYVYILADESFEKFAFLFFEGLTPDDFFEPARGSRGKSRMNKEKGMKKCTPLFGSFTKRNDTYIDALNADIREATEKFKNRMESLYQRSTSTEKKRAHVRRLITSEMSRVEKKMSKLQDRIAYWEEAPDSFTFILEELA
jgi:hypothetical protein